MLKNRKNAWIHFYPEGNGKAKPGYVLHHKDETLRKNDPERYNEWRIEDLEMMTMSEHFLLHHKDTNKSEIHRLHVSQSLKGHVVSEETRRKLSEAGKGRTISEETRRKMSEAGKKRMTNEERERIRRKLIGHDVSEETRRKISEANKKRIEFEKNCA